MDQQTDYAQVTAIIPALNEAGRIAAVLDVVSTYPEFAEVIVVDDGSTDATAQIVRQYPVRFLQQATNRGKGEAMELGVQAAKTDIIFFCDADVSGLTHSIIEQIIRPVQRGQVDMFVGMRNRKMYWLHQILVLTPLVGGERAVTTQLWQRLPDYYKHSFRIEAGLNFYSIYYGQGFHYKIFHGLTQVIKEKKYGWKFGLRQRAQMFATVIRAQFKLQFVDIPPSAKSRRRLGLVAAQSVVGVGLGAACLFAAWVGPSQVADWLLAGEFQDDPAARTGHWLVSIASATTISAVMITGVLLVVINAATVVWTLQKLGTTFIGLRRKLANNKT